ncbi:MAG TPA: amidohydrolase family protein [Candidatus Binataceae bacterium]|nr:amidohydrolase family protein [Candidatus Binataceae bacterium]
MYDLMIRGGTIVDGSGLPSFKADLAVKGGKIAQISGRIKGSARREIDADGCIVAPGAIDLHCHYDAQLNWDPYCTLSGWHGVTSVVIGQCGLGLAPTRPAERDLAMSIMTRTEAIPLAAMQQGLRWDWETFPEYLDSLGRQGLGVNVASLLPYSPLRIYVLGPDAALEREQVTGRELKQLVGALREAMEAGAFGFSIDKLWENRMADGRLLPDHVASNEEVMALADVFADFGVGHLSWTRGPSERRGGDVFLRELAARSGRPLNLVGVAATSLAPGSHRKMLAYLEESHRLGLPMYGSAICMDIPVAMTLAEFNMFDTMPHWVEPFVGTPGERAAKLALPQTRAAMRRDLERSPHQAFARGWTLINVLETKKEPNHGFDGLSIAQMAQRLGKDPLDAMLDLALDEGLETEFGFLHVGGDEDGTIELCRHPYTHISNSDGGAHVRFLTISTWPIHFLSRLVRDRQAMALEQAHYKISGLPAYIAGFTDRGMLKVGMAADIIVYRMDELGFLYEKPVFATDFPGGCPRLVQKPKGLHYTIVNGTVTFEDNRCTGELPGKLLRSYEMIAGV